MGAVSMDIKELAVMLKDNAVIACLIALITGWLVPKPTHDRVLADNADMKKVIYDAVAVAGRALALQRDQS